MRWIFSINPVNPDVAIPGRLVTNRKLPQNYFDARDKPGLEQANPTTTTVEFQNLSETHSVLNNNAFHAHLTSFFSKRLNIGSHQIRSIEASKAEKCQLLQAGEWLNTISSSKASQMWLEQNINLAREKVWMVTETLILTGTKIQSIDQHQHSIGGDLSAPVLSIAGITIPTPLDPSVGAATVRESKHERGVSVPERMVFAIRYMRVKLLRRKRGDATKTGVNDYRLESKAN